MMNWFVPFFYMEVNFGLSKKGQNAIDINWDELFQKDSGLHLLCPQNEWRQFRGGEIWTSWPETKKVQIKLATTYKKNKQKKKDAKDNA